MSGKQEIAPSSGLRESEAPNRLRGVSNSDEQIRQDSRQGLGYKGVNDLGGLPAPWDEKVSSVS